MDPSSARSASRLCGTFLSLAVADGILNRAVLPGAPSFFLGVLLFVASKKFLRGGGRAELRLVSLFFGDFQDVGHGWEKTASLQVALAGSLELFCVQAAAQDAQPNFRKHPSDRLVVAVLREDRQPFVDGVHLQL